MKEFKNVVMIFSLLMFCAFFLPNPPAVAQDVKILSHEIKKELRTAKGLMFKGEAKEALSLLDGIQGKIGELKSADPEHSSIKEIERDYNKLKKDLSRRIGKDKAAKLTEKVPASKTAFDRSDKMSSAAARYVRKMDDAMKGVDRKLSGKFGTPEARVKEARYEMKTVEGYWKDLQKKYPGTLEHPDVVAVKRRMDEYYEKIDAYGKAASEGKVKENQSRAVKKALSDEWSAKLTPYVSMKGQQGYVPEKVFIPSYTEDSKDMGRRMKLYAEASNLFAEYREAHLPEGKTDELLNVEKKLAYKLKTYNEGLIMMADHHFKKAARGIADGKSHLDKNTERTRDGKTKPILLHSLVLDGISRDIARGENVMPGDGRILELKREFEALQKEQSRWREKMIESTVMVSHKFKGKESSKLKEMSENIVKEKYCDAKILRVNIISSDWKEEQALEFTDTTRTAIRYRITRSVTGQVAAKCGDDCFLYTTYIAKDRRSDGSWEEYHGHIMFADRILEENVNK